jgi:hypothetical protein
MVFCKSSLFLIKDTIDEQNELYENVFPKLREFTMYRYGLEFQVINFHWGISDKLIDNKFLLEYCLNEINRSKDCSIGPTFLVKSLFFSKSFCFYVFFS